MSRTATVTRKTRETNITVTLDLDGSGKADLEPLAHDAFHDVCTPGNPRQATQEDILAIYKSLM